MAVELAPVNLYRLVRSFSLRAPAYADAIRYFSKPDERFNLPLVAQRVYGDWDETLAIQAAAGLDSPEQELTERLLVLPSLQQLRRMKQVAGYVVVNAGR